MLLLRGPQLILLMPRPIAFLRQPAQLQEAGLLCRLELGELGLKVAHLRGHRGGLRPGVIGLLQGPLPGDLGGVELLLGLLKLVLQLRQLGLQL